VTRSAGTGSSPSGQAAGTSSAPTAAIKRGFHHHDLTETTCSSTWPPRTWRTTWTSVSNRTSSKGSLLPRTTRRTRKTTPEKDDGWRGRRLTFPDGRLISETFLERFKKLGVTRKAFAKEYNLNARDVGHVLRGDLRAHLRTFAAVGYILGFTLNIELHQLSLLERLAWAAEGIDPYKVEGF
jgi:hypothetical protein